MLRDITSSLAFWVANDPVTQQSRLCGVPECDTAKLNLLLRMLADKLGLDMGLTYQWLEGSQLELVECPECGCRKRVCAWGLCRGCCSRLVCECWVHQEDSKEEDQVKVVEHFSKVSWGVPTGLATNSGGVALRHLAWRLERASRWPVVYLDDVVFPGSISVRRPIKGRADYGRDLICRILVQTQGQKLVQDLKEA